MPFAVSAVAAAAVVGTAVAVGSQVYSGIQKHNDANRAARAAAYSEHETRIMTAIDLMRQERKAYQIEGAQQADVAGAGFSESGTALDLLHSSVANASLDRTLLATRGELEAHGLAAEVTADKNAATSDLITGGAGAVSDLFKGGATIAQYA